MISSGTAGREYQHHASGVAFLGMLAVHVVAGATLFGVPASRDAGSLPVYTVELVAAPRPESQRRRAPQVLERPAERPAPAPDQRRPRRTSMAEEMPPPPPQPQVEREPAARTTPEEQLPPEAEPSTGTDVTTVKTSGVDFPYPAYLRNVVAQIYRRWRRPTRSTPLRAEILFFVHRDGSVSGIQFVRRSGSFAFDLEAQGAIEAAGNFGAFGPLPEGYESDILPVSFFFDPRSLRSGT